MSSIIDFLKMIIFEMEYELSPSLGSIFPPVSYFP